MSDLKKILAIFLALGLLATTLTLLFNSTSATNKPKLTLTYLYQTNDSSGQAIALFAVTNNGYSTLLNFGISYLEFSSNSNLHFLAQSTAHQAQLSRGEGDIILVRTPAGAEGHWRLKYYFAKKGIRFWLVRHSWNEFMPKFLKTTNPLNITVTSDWIDPQK